MTLTPNRAGSKDAPSMAQAVEGATGKLTRLVATQLRRVVRSDRSPAKPAFD